MVRVLHRLMLLLVLVAVQPMGAALAQVQFPQTPLQVIAADGRRHDFTVEVASSADQLAQGLMYRTKLAAAAGMLFDFGAPRSVAMWMKNTLIPLDMLFITDNGRIAGISQRAVPHSTVTISSPGDVKAVLELNGGTASRLGIKVGDRVVHPIFSSH
ncbi:conserved exported protein of unknown function [Magnetospirillum gryphiswaldense MSR-1 v2]|uniref:DUF192 domain-containing protein n=1 Tax=Magnetospirillum gryphiswaldense (strain DSM 6361 / JCM 21280 / NBRC 15271 / MSR-1) TaxID=431944 RepID=V6F1H3_MAGGM|nr:DUF192 domain-containing protein [Magnetospirillum gryphiswaldense]CDK99370.1 conserved exported protein of unknown function [Magnetospirillum gryphiswaldense MSR-1 v2]